MFLSLSDALTDYVTLFWTGDLKARSKDLKMTASTTNSKMSLEIRSIVDDYGATLAKALAEIKTLTKAKASIEKAYEELMVVNENLIQDLVRSYFIQVSLDLLFTCWV